MLILLQGIDELSCFLERFVTLKPPKCQGCGEWIDKTCLKVTTQKCIVVNLQGISPFVFIYIIWF